MWQDLRVAWRFLLKRRTATAVAVLTLGIAVAVCTMAVGLADKALWRPLALDNAAGLVTLYNSRPAAPGFQVFSYPDYKALHDTLQDDVDLAAFVRIEQTIGGGREPVRARGEIVSANYFDVLGVKPFAGRFLSGADGSATPPAAVVLCHDLWRTRFGSDPSVIGRPIRLGADTCIVLGIAPSGFHGPAYPTDFWVPLTMARQVFGGPYLERSDVPLFQTVGRLEAGTVPAQLEARVQGLATFASADGWRVRSFPASYLTYWPAYRGSIARYLALFVAIALCILGVATANLASLLVARASERRQELAVRQALGASRTQLFRRVAAESLILAALGGAVGVVLAFWSASAVARVPLPVPVTIGIAADGRLGAIAITIALGAAIVFTLLSTSRSMTHLRSVLGSSGRTVTAGTGRQRVLVICQIAVSCAVLVAGGLLAKSALNVASVDIGFEPSQAVVGEVDLDGQGYSPGTGARFYRALTDTSNADPRIEAATLGWNVPLGAVRATQTFTLPDPAPPVRARYDVVGAGYFAALRVPVRGGREFGDADSERSEPVAIVNETMAHLFRGSAVGQAIRLPGETTPRRVVGIAADIKYNAITESSLPFVYLPAAQVYRPDMHVYVRTRSPGAEDAIRQALRTLDPDVPLSGLHTLDEQVTRARSVPMTAARVSTGAALLAVFLALVGIYGLLTTSVECRRRELAIRAALGATPSLIVRRVLVEGAALTIVGIALGLAGSAAAGRYIASQLFEVGPFDPAVYALVPILITAASAAAWIAPALRAASVDPVVVLRGE
jgi:predicted permease